MGEFVRKWMRRLTRRGVTVATPDDGSAVIAIAYRSDGKRVVIPAGWKKQ